MADHGYCRTLFIFLFLFLAGLPATAQRKRPSFQGLIDYDVSVTSEEDHNIHNLLFMQENSPVSLKIRFGPGGALRVDYTGNCTECFEYELILPKEKEHYVKFRGNDTLFHFVKFDRYDSYNVIHPGERKEISGRKCRSVYFAEVREGMTDESVNAYYDPSLYLDPKPYAENDSLFWCVVLSHCKSPVLGLVEEISTFGCKVTYTVYQIDPSPQDPKWFIPDPALPFKIR